jgi:hypothetical protein
MNLYSQVQHAEKLVRDEEKRYSKERLRTDYHLRMIKKRELDLNIAKERHAFHILLLNQIENDKIIQLSKLSKLKLLLEEERAGRVTG